MIYWFGSDMKSEESDGSLFDKEAYNSDSINQDGFQIDNFILEQLFSASELKISINNLQVATVLQQLLQAATVYWRQIIDSRM